MKALVIGYGSIGQRHVRILKDMGIEISIVTRRDIQGIVSYSSIQEAMASKSFNYIIVANETASHFITLKEIVDSNFQGKLLIEKPLFMKMEYIEFDSKDIFVAYNLRFHPLIREMKKLLLGEKIISVNAYAGQYLPNWRSNTDYSKGYSASSKRGGGVLRDLSHELDYLTLLFGEWVELVAKKERISNLNIQSEDHVQILYKTNQSVHIALELNYLDRIQQRYVNVQTNNKTIKIDFIENTINCNGELQQLNKVDRDYTYIKQHESMIKNSTELCTFDEGLNVLKMIEAVEKSAHIKEVVYND